MTATSAHPTRTALLSAGLRLAERDGLAKVSVNGIVREARVAKGTFYVHFPDRRDYFVALHRDFHDALERDVESATAPVDGARERLEAGATAYLDGCLRQSGVKALLLEARAEPAVHAEVRSRNRRFAHRARGEFATLGWPAPEHAARLFVAMAAETALGELEAGRRVQALRDTLLMFLRAKG
ncbi:MAG TPA: helix-turn-helix domain-containing protein [Nevskiaceae bacterium]|nr:helix-turn-helix domain-containing protein [Nevskiaceae bacterium]